MKNYLNQLAKKDNLTWQDIVYGIVKHEKMDPYNINTPLLIKKCKSVVKLLKSKKLPT